jgi:hypothetical protein
MMLPGMAMLRVLERPCSARWKTLVGLDVFRAEFRARWMTTGVRLRFYNMLKSAFIVIFDLTLEPSLVIVERRSVQKGF